ncbi:hypothetical protein [Aeromonas jandaei]|uniref:hypothetical protein n=1 Tax=Aeromonas jandaei TaxID=650 RepID=UPI00366B9DBC
MHNFDSYLADSVSRISAEYFQLEVNGSNTVIFRERVYCYELYHQLRNCWPNETNWKICGEIDKRGHPVLRDSDESPDFLVHVPGEPANFAIVEVKPADFDRQKLIKDFRTIVKFMQSNHAGYERGICLIYGDKPRLIRNITNAVTQFVQDGHDASNIEIWHHPSVGARARHISIEGTKVVVENNV